ncbi:hypothetical protein BACPLE_01173 [Phocaeicola plebeius DSM 17135]|uniref:Uncharacterized protein n=1 Tax=Phocaeicola plebeius (strain DSM 17135 / JCM 12973 / CCUG 54634 / M2) TaxID=484018 RepID=B5CWT4_PHOPM|nr:hypothetical protein BACPLE_01173 [Phocaeicola plebeius DSM 17135]
MQNHVGGKKIGQFLIGEGGRCGAGIAGLPLTDVFLHKLEIVGREAALIVFFQRAGLTEIVAGEIEGKAAHGIRIEQIGCAGADNGIVQTGTYVIKKAAVGRLCKAVAEVQQIGHIRTAEGECGHAERPALRTGFGEARECGRRKAGKLMGKELSDTGCQRRNGIEPGDGESDIFEELFIFIIFIISLISCNVGTDHVFIKGVGRGGIGCQKGNDTTVIPSTAGFQLLRGYHVIGIGRKD